MFDKKVNVKTPFGNLECRVQIDDSKPRPVFFEVKGPIIPNGNLINLIKKKKRKGD